MKKEKEKEVIVGSPGEESDDKQSSSFPSARFSTRNASSKYDFVKVSLSISPTSSIFFSLPFLFQFLFCSHLGQGLVG